MQHKLFDVSTESLNKREESSLISFIYGNENNVNNFPASSFVKSKKDMYDEMANTKSIFDLANTDNNSLDDQCVM